MLSISTSILTRPTLVSIYEHVHFFQKLVVVVWAFTKGRAFNVTLRLWQCFQHLFAATVLEHAPLEAVYIYFDTATYDEIERDVKV